MDSNRRITRSVTMSTISNGSKSTKNSNSRKATPVKKSSKSETAGAKSRKLTPVKKSSKPQTAAGTSNSKKATPVKKSSKSETAAAKSRKAMPVKKSSKSETAAAKSRKAMPVKKSSKPQTASVSCSTGNAIKSKLSSSKSTDSSDNEPLEQDIAKGSVACGICYNDVDILESEGRKLVATLCGHVFCNICIRRAIRRNDVCPKCRRYLSLQDFHPLHI